jgi:uroporphyrin-III C-methyltransferase/precorrin-2 dehydrogenase/sirohydrochlorin ferrochelatase
MRYFPTFFDLRDKPCLVVGGGEAALGKIRLLLKAGAQVRVVADRVQADIEDLAAQGTLEIQRGGFVAGDLRGQTLAIVASGDDALDARVAGAARSTGISVNVVDRPHLSSFTVPALIDRDPVVVAVSTGGTAPVLGRKLRAQIEALLPARLGHLAELAERFRDAVKATRPGAGARRAFWESFFESPAAEDALAGRNAAARDKALTLVNRAPRDTGTFGSVAIVGAGPGDPDLLTLRAAEHLQRADVIVYDKLVGPEVLDRARRDAERIYVGKSRGHHAKTQDQINALLLRLARDGKRVVRLKGGDPFVFGRGGEELEFLRRRGVAVQVVPGITAATACGAAAGIPLTHRGDAAAVTFVTGHGKDGEPDLDWQALASARHTLVVYMGVATAPRTAARLIEHGLPASTPIAVIENGTRPDERVLTGRLDELARVIRDESVAGPAVIVIGEVARRAESAKIFAAPQALAV